ncbi:hypothetical protein BpHYR1_015146 [Brachionus plicatilis]|uniref:Uncharacterized protein n=1 Tax=Brachionus plicatilis TaxID=10195 RepID=A0A3M7R1W4_BRAPC|nr:hypothetical protein BpHYR1_015146 [Brachionus plicatilis]
MIMSISPSRFLLAVKRYEKFDQQFYLNSTELRMKLSDKDNNLPTPKKKPTINPIFCKTPQFSLLHQKFYLRKC